MPNYEEHVLSGLVSYPFIVLLCGFLTSKVIPVELTPLSLIIGYAFYVLGSDLPDMDHPNALLHRGAKAIVAVLVGGVAYLNLAGSFKLGPPWLDVAATWGVSALAALGAWYVFTLMMPNHRGVMHSLLFASIYGLLAFLTVEYGLRMRSGEALYVAIVSFCGYTLHLLLDREIKLL